MNSISCPVCGGDRFTPLMKGKDRLHRVDDQVFQVVRCEGCALAMLNPQPSVEELNKYYPETYGPYQTSMQTVEAGPFLSAVKKVLRRNASAAKPAADTSVLTYLDFGCGGGGQLERARAAHPNWRFYGLDNSPKACEAATSRGFTVHCGDIRDMPVPEGGFDIVNMSHVIEHLTDPEETLRGIHRVMKPGGKLIVATPNFDSYAARMFGTYWYALDLPRHLFFFDPASLARLLEKSGFRRTALAFDPGPKVFIRSVRHVVGSRKMSISPVIWRLLLPFSRWAAARGKTSIMTLEAQRV